jgi:hypothetical protein
MMASDEIVIQRQDMPVGRNYLDVKTILVLVNFALPMPGYYTLQLVLDGAQLSEQHFLVEVQAPEAQAARSTLGGADR